MSGTQQKLVEFGGQTIPLSTPVFGWLRATAAAQAHISEVMRKGSIDRFLLLSDVVLFSELCLVIASGMVKWDGSLDDAGNLENLNAMSQKLMHMCNEQPGIEAFTNLMAIYVSVCEITYPEAFQKKTTPLTAVKKRSTGTTLTA